MKFHVAWSRSDAGPEGWIPRELVVFGVRCLVFGERTTCLKRWRDGFLYRNRDVFRERGSFIERHSMKTRGIISLVN